MVTELWEKAITTGTSNNKPGRRFRKIACLVYGGIEQLAFQGVFQSLGKQARSSANLLKELCRGVW
jgi:hypothetical protein